MKLEKFVKKHTKTIMLVIVVVMAFSLVFTYNIGSSGDSDRGEEIEGTFTIDGKQINVTKTEFYDVYQLVNLYMSLRFLAHCANSGRYAGPLNVGDEPLDPRGHRLGIVESASSSQVTKWFFKNLESLRSRFMGLKRGQDILMFPYGISIVDLDDSKQREVIAWETIIMKHAAQQAGITVSVDEIAKFRSERIMAGGRSGGGGIVDMNTLLKERSPSFLDPKSAEVRVNEAIYNTLLITKFLESLTEFKFPAVSAVYDSFYSEFYARKQYKFTLINPKELAMEIREPSSAEMFKFYEQNKERLKSEERVVLYYIAAFYDKNKKLAPVPTEQEAEDYYNKNKKDEFKIEGQEEKYKEFKEVKDQIIEKLHKKAIKEKLFGAMYDEVKAKITQAIDKLPKPTEQEAEEYYNKNKEQFRIVGQPGRYKEFKDVKDQIVEKLYKEKQKDPQEVGRIASKVVTEINDGKKYELKFDVTRPLTLSNYEELEKEEMGKDSKLKEILNRDPDWKIPVGEMSGVAESEKASIFYIMDKREERKPLGPSSPRTREYVKRHLLEQKLWQRADTKAKDIAKEINTNGPLARPDNARFYATDYIDPLSQEDRPRDRRMDPGGGIKLKDASTTYDKVKELTLDKTRAKSFAVQSTTQTVYQVVIYLDDIYYPSGEKEIDDRITQERKEKISEERLRKMEEERSRLTKQNVEMLVKSKK